MGFSPNIFISLVWVRQTNRSHLTSRCHHTPSCPIVPFMASDGVRGPEAPGSPSHAGPPAPQAGADDAAGVHGCSRRSPAALKTPSLTPSHVTEHQPASSSASSGLKLLLRRRRSKERTVPAVPEAGWTSRGSRRQTAGIVMKE